MPKLKKRCPDLFQTKESNSSKTTNHNHKKLKKKKTLAPKKHQQHTQNKIPPITSNTLYCSYRRRTNPKQKQQPKTITWK